MKRGLPNVIRWSAPLLAFALGSSPGVGAAQEAGAALERRVRALGAKFSGGRGCDPEAFAELKSLRDEHGVEGAVGQAMALAYRGCDDDLGWAQLFATLIDADDTDEDRLKLVAAWLLAGRWAEAHAVALPLAKAQGPQSRAAWLVGYTLFQLDQWDAARPWLLGARATVDGKKRSDAPIMLAWVQLEAGDGAAAKAELDAGLEQLPDEPSLHAVRAQVLARLGETAEAEQVADRAREFARAREAKARQRARLTALDLSWSAARRDGDDAAAAALIDRIAAEGAPQDVVALFERRASALEASGEGATARRLRSHIRTLKRSAAR